MRLAEHFIPFHNSFNKSNNTGARMLDSIYHMTLKQLEMTFWRENPKICHTYATLLRPSLRNVTEI